MFKKHEIVTQEISYAYGNRKVKAEEGTKEIYGVWEFSKLMTDKKSQIQKSQKTLNRVNAKMLQWGITIVEEKNTGIKSWRKPKKPLSQRVRSVRLTRDFSSKIDK